MSKILASAIVKQIPGAVNVHVEGEYVFVGMGDDKPIVRYRLSPEAQRVALLEREGRPLDVQPGEVKLLPVPPED